MKVLFVNYEFPPVGGGAARASLATARELVAIGHQVDFLTIDTTDADADALLILNIYIYFLSLYLIQFYIVINCYTSPIS